MPRKISFSQPDKKSHRVSHSVLKGFGVKEHAVDITFAPEAEIEKFKTVFVSQLHHKYDVNVSRLHSVLVANFNLEELKTICFKLDVDFDELPGEGKSVKARELIMLMQRQDRLNELAALIWQLRPKIPIRRLYKSTRLQTKHGTGRFPPVQVNRLPKVQIRAGVPIQIQPLEYKSRGSRRIIRRQKGSNIDL